MHGGRSIIIPLQHCNPPSPLDLGISKPLATIQVMRRERQDTPPPPRTRFEKEKSDGALPPSFLHNSARYYIEMEHGKKRISFFFHIRGKEEW